MSVRTLARIATAALFALGLASQAPAQYPSHQITMVVPFPPGGITDTLARALAQKLQQELGEIVIVNNRPGAGGQLGANVLKSAPADGHTLFVGATEMFAINQKLYREFSYDPIEDMKAVAPLAASPLVLIVPNESPANSVEELVKLSKDKSVNYASQGIGSIGHLLGEMFRANTGGNLNHIAYRGSTPALKDLAGNQVDMMFDPVLTANPLILDGRLKALGIAAPKNAPILPAAKPLSQLGVSGVEASVWFGVVVKAGTPDEIVQRLNAVITKSMNSPEIADRFSPMGLEMMSMDSAQFAQFMQDEVQRWTPIIKTSIATADSPPY